MTVIRVAALSFTTPTKSITWLLFTARDDLAAPDH